MNQEEAVQLLLSDRIMFIETLMRIQDKQRNLVPYKLTPIPKDMLETATGRDIYVKPAQVGASSVFIVDFLIDCLTIEGTVAVIISYNEFITGRLLRKAEQFYNFLQELIPTVDKMKHNSTYEKTFNKMGSSFYICSAGTNQIIRGEVIHNLLIDEYAFWPGDSTERLFASALQRVPLTKDSKIRFCSTPNGEDNDFYEMYMNAKEGKKYRNSVYTDHFYPWYQHPEYIMTSDDPFALPGDDCLVLKDLISEELALLKVFEGMGLDEVQAHDKIRWRRYKIAEMASARRSGDTRLLFNQEYPENDIDCFLQAGDMVYPHEEVNDMAKDCYPALSHHLFADIWYSPENDKKYLIGVDPGEGKISESVATVWYIDNPESDDEKFIHCATLSGFYDQSEMADKVKDLGIYYNTAVIAAEDALDFIPYIKDYPELYYMTDPTTDRITSSIGWKSTGLTKPYMISAVLKNFSKIKTHDIRIVSQFRNIRWIVGSNNKVRAIALGNDDYHDSAAIFVVCRKALPIERGFVGTAGWPDSWGK